MPNQIDFQKVALETLRIEEQALQILATQIDERFSQACEIILQCKGRLVITGMGNPGILAVRWRQLCIYGYAFILHAPGRGRAW